MRRIGLAVLVFALCVSARSVLAVTVLDFEGLGDEEEILDYYNGGLGSLGSGPGPNFGIQFGSDALSLIDTDTGGSGNFANEPSPNTIAFFLSGPGVVMNVANGFTTGFSFFYSSSTPASVTVYDGLNATGNVLATLDLTAQGTAANGCTLPGDPTGTFACWDPIGVTFSGTAFSVNFAGAANQTGFDNITLESSTPPVCGNGTFEPGEECDDGNLINGDGCSSTCHIEVGMPCSTDDECNDNNACTDEACVNGFCAYTNNANPCDDGFFCTLGDTCAGGVCKGTARDCSAAADQCNNGVCNEAAAGACEPQPKANTTPCNDGDACTTGDHCSAGSCTGGPPPHCDDGNECTADSCDHAIGCVNDTAPRNGFACDDDNACTERDACSNGICRGVMTGADSDGDGYCDFQEIQAGCNPYDLFEVPPQPVAAVGQPGEGGSPLSNGLLTYAAPAARRRAKISVGADPSCATLGVCGPRGFCSAGKIGDPCTANGDCNQPANTCRLIVNFANVSDLALTDARLKRTPVPGFTPATRGCSRKVDVTLGPLPRRRRIPLSLRATGTLGGRPSHDRDIFWYGH